MKDLMTINFYWHYGAGGSVQLGENSTNTLPILPAFCISVEAMVKMFFCTFATNIDKQIFAVKKS